MTSSVTLHFALYILIFVFKRGGQGGNGSKILGMNSNIGIIFVGYICQRRSIKINTSQDRRSKVKVTGLSYIFDT